MSADDKGPIEHEAFVSWFHTLDMKQRIAVWYDCECLTTQEVEGQLAEARSLATAERLRAEKAEGLLGNLLARIHRDGGHHQDRVGVGQACQDADAQVVRWLASDPTAQGRASEDPLPADDLCRRCNTYPCSCGVDWAGQPDGAVEPAEPEQPLPLCPTKAGPYVCYKPLGHDGKCWARGEVCLGQRDEPEPEQPAEVKAAAGEVKPKVYFCVSRRLCGSALCGGWPGSCIHTYCSACDAEPGQPCKQPVIAPPLPPSPDASKPVTYKGPPVSFRAELIRALRRLAPSANLLAPEEMWDALADELERGPQ